MISAGLFISKLIEAFIPLEEDGIDIDTKWNVNVNTGDMLDQIGDIFELDRGILSDDDYRNKILAQIGINTSIGNINDLIRVFKIISNAENVRIITLGSGLMDVELKGDELYIDVEDINRIPAGGCGIGHIYLWDDSTFTLDDDFLGLDQGLLTKNIL